MIEFFNYNPETGRISKKNGREVGGLDKGYVRIHYKGKLYMAHRIAWYLYHGRWPLLLDHINGIGSDNRILNLREATSRQNNQNTEKHRLGKLTGTSLRKNGKYRSRIRINKKLIHLGDYMTELEAHHTYLKALGEL